jgi:ferritin
MTESHSQDEKIQLEKISRFLRLDDARPLLAKVEDRRNRCLSSLRVNTETIEIGRSQGRIEILDWLLGLKED